jgi:hypothetical protein
MFYLGHILLVALFGLTEFILKAFDFLFFFNGFLPHSLLELLLLDLHALQVAVTFISDTGFKFFLLTLVALLKL